MKELWKKFNQVCDYIADGFVLLFAIALFFAACWLGYWARKEIVKDAIREVKQEEKIKQ